MIIPSLTAEFTLTEEDYRELPKLTDDELESLPDLDPNMDGYIKRNSNSNLTGRVSGILGENGVSGEIKKIGFFPPNDPNGQGKEGSCFSWSLATVETYYYFKEKGFGSYYLSKLLNIMDDNKRMSPAYIYHFYTTSQRRKNIGLGMEILNNLGTSTWKQMPYLTPYKDQVPSQEAFQFAKGRAEGLMIRNLYTIENLKQIKSAIDKGYPVLIGVRIDDNFFHQKLNNNYEWVLTQEDRNLTSSQYIDKYKDRGHGMVVYGYSGNDLLVRNSWGTKFGDKGDFWLKRETLTHPGVFMYAVIYTKRSLYNVVHSTNTLFGDFLANWDNLVPACIGTSFISDPTNNDLGQVVQFTQKDESRIELIMDDQIPREGTIEMKVYVTKAYGYSNYKEFNDSTAFLLSTDCSGADVYWPGSMNLSARSDGMVQFSICTEKYGVPPGQIISGMSSFRFNEWHTISISYGSRGMAIKVDNELVASESTFTQPIDLGGDHVNRVDKFTIGEPYSYYGWGNNRYERGFEGYLHYYRTSKKQNDWQYNE